jgi:aryl-alcohol dehydrogenase-like predicted oxidoreductase
VTKIGTDLDASPPRKRFDMAFLRSAFERSQERLGRDKLDVVLIHNPTMLAMSKSEPFDFLKELKRLGALRAWGVSAGGVEVARAAIQRGAEVLELTYNLLLASDLHLLSSEIVASGVGVLARSVLAHGLLTGSFSPDQEFPAGDHRADRWTSSELKQRISQVEALRPAVNGPIPTLRAAALRFVLSNQLISSAVLGPRSVAQLDELVQEADIEPPYLRDTVLAELSVRLKNAGAPL